MPILNIRHLFTYTGGEKQKKSSRIQAIHNFRSLVYSARKLSALSSLAVPELDEPPIASGDFATGKDSGFRVVGIPDISWIDEVANKLLENTFLNYLQLSSSLVCPQQNTRVQVQFLH